MISTKQITKELTSHPILRHVHKLLEKWAGKEVRLCNLTVNHRKIQLKISDDRYNNNIPHLLITIHEPIKMNGSFDWDYCDIEIQFNGTNYKVIDTKNTFEIIGNSISVKEHK